jgi:hypothetical protein
MSFGEQMPKSEQNDHKDERQIEGDIDLIRRGASYEITGMPSDLADDLIKEQSGELYPDLASFIMVNKTVACPKEEWSENTTGRLTNAKGILRQEGNSMYYVDSNGDISTFRIAFEDLQNIRSMREIERSDFHSIYRQLENLGFKWYNQKPEVQDAIMTAVYQYRRRAAEQEKTAKHDNFNF